MSGRLDVCTTSEVVLSPNVSVVEMVSLVNVSVTELEDDSVSIVSERLVD